MNYKGILPLAAAGILGFGAGYLYHNTSMRNDIRNNANVRVEDVDKNGLPDIRLYLGDPAQKQELKRFYGSRDPKNPSNILYLDVSPVIAARKAQYDAAHDRTEQDAKTEAQRKKEFEDAAREYAQPK